MKCKNEFLAFPKKKAGLQELYDVNNSLSQQEMPTCFENGIECFARKWGNEKC
jgi:hypothetical protein